MGIAGAAKNYDIAAHFRVRIDGFQDADFQACEGLKAVKEYAEYKSGGEATAHKQFTGKVTFPDITLRRGSCSDYDMFQWFSEGVQLTAAQAGADAIGLAYPNNVRNLEICTLDVDGTIKKSWTVRCEPAEFCPSDAGWKGDSKDVVIESLVLKVHGFDLTG
jgi:phage tail-like protein